MEQLYGTKARLWGETAPLSGVSASDVVRFPIRSIGFERDIHQRSQTIDAFRQRSRAIPLHESYRVRSTHDLTLDLFEFLMATLSAPTLGEPGWRDLDRRASVPSFRAEFETERGRRYSFSGMTPTEIELNMRGRRAAELSISWIACDRNKGIIPKAIESELSSRLVPSRLTRVQLLDSDVGTAPLRPENDVVAFSFDLFIRRDTQATQFGPDGIPRRHRSAPLRVVAAVDLPPNTMTATAKSRWDGSVALQMSDEVRTLDCRLPLASGFCSADEPVAYDFATETLLLETSPDESGTPARYRID